MMIALMAVYLLLLFAIVRLGIVRFNYGLLRQQAALKRLSEIERLKPK
ncbi:hypothetical protein [Bradyrhizobium sp. RDI18]